MIWIVQTHSELFCLAWQLPPPSHQPHSTGKAQAKGVATVCVCVREKQRPQTCVRKHHPIIHTNSAASVKVGMPALNLRKKENFRGRRGGRREGRVNFALLPVQLCS